ncbi:hypothetical protein J6590_076541 [Homalodisca vitripennis]|nr:hypothetical protein J6590_076541 [Homalodisca vitripennis]
MMSSTGQVPMYYERALALQSRSEIYNTLRVGPFPGASYDAHSTGQEAEICGKMRGNARELRENEGKTGFLLSVAGRLSNRAVTEVESEVTTTYSHVYVEPLVKLGMR